LPKKQNNSQAVAAVVILLVVVAIAGAVVFFSGGTRRPTAAGPMNLPLIKTALVAADGEEYVVQTRFSVQIEQAGRVTRQQVTDMLSAIVAELDIDKITQAGGVRYIREHAAEALSGALQANAQVYLTDFAYNNKGARVVLPEGNNTTRRDQVIRGIFGNMD